MRAPSISLKPTENSHGVRAINWLIRSLACWIEWRDSLAVVMHESLMELPGDRNGLCILREDRPTA